MSNTSEPKTISVIEVNGRIAEIERQRDCALNRAAFLAGANAELADLVQILKGEVSRLEGVVRRQSELIPDGIDRDGAQDLDAQPQL